MINQAVTSETLDRNQRLLDRSFFPVQKIESKDPETGKPLFHIVNMESGRKLSQVSNRYTLVPNRALVLPIISHFGLENLVGFQSNGSSFYYKINTGRAMTIGNSDDKINEQVIIFNSYDKSQSFNFFFGAFRWVCRNGLFSGHSFFNMKKIHVGEIPIGEITSKVLNHYQDNDFSLWRDFARRQLTLAEQTELLNDMSLLEVKKPKEKLYYCSVNDNQYLNERIKQASIRRVSEPETIDNQRNAWGLYNQINSSINVYINEQGKKVLANKRAEEYIGKALSLV